MSKNGNKIKKGEKRRRREARERRPPRNCIRCELLPETPSSAEWPPPRPSHTETLSKAKLPFEKKMRAPRQWPQRPGRLLPGNAAPPPPGSLPGTRTPQARPGSPDGQSAGGPEAEPGPRRRAAGGSGQGPGVGSLPTSTSHPEPLGGLQGPGDLCRHTAGGCGTALNPAARFPVWGTSWRLCILEKKAQAALQQCLGHQPRERVLTGKAEGSPAERLVWGPGAVAQRTDATRSSAVPR